VGTPAPARQSLVTPLTFPRVPARDYVAYSAPDANTVDVSVRPGETTRGPMLLHDAVSTFPRVPARLPWVMGPGLGASRPPLCHVGPMLSLRSLFCHFEHPTVISSAASRTRANRHARHFKHSCLFEHPTCHFEHPPVISSTHLSFRAKREIFSPHLHLTPSVISSEARNLFSPPTPHPWCHFERSEKSFLPTYTSPLVSFRAQREIFSPFCKPHKISPHFVRRNDRVRGRGCFFGVIPDAVLPCSPIIVISSEARNLCPRCIPSTRHTPYILSFRAPHLSFRAPHLSFRAPTCHFERSEKSFPPYLHITPPPVISSTPPVISSEARNLSPLLHLTPGVISSEARNLPLPLVPASHDARATATRCRAFW